MTKAKIYLCLNYLTSPHQGRIQDFKLGGAHLKKQRRAEGGANIFGLFRVKNHDFTPKNFIFSNFRGGARRVSLPGSAPAHNSCIKNETRVREAEGIFKIEVPDNVRKIVIVKTQVHGVMTYITPLFFCNFFSYTSQHNFGIK